MDFVTIASKIQDVQTLLLLVGGLSAIALFFTVLGLVRANRLKAETDSKIRLMKAENDRQREQDQREVIKSREAIQLKELEYQAAESERNAELLKRYADGLDRVAGAMEQAGDIQRGQNSIMRSMSEMQSDAFTTHQANSQRIQDLQKSTAEGFATLAVKVEEMVKALGEVKLITETGLVEHREQLEATNTRIDNITQNMRNVLAKINELGITAAELKRELVTIGRVEKIDEIGRLAGEMMQIVRTMDDRLSKIKRIDTGKLPETLPATIEALKQKHSEQPVGHAPKRPTGTLPPVPPPPDVPLTTPPDVHITKEIKITPPPTPADLPPLATTTGAPTDA